MDKEGLHSWADRFEGGFLQMIQDHNELFKRCIEVVEMADNVKSDLDKSYFEYSLSFICVLFVTYKG